MGLFSKRFGYESPAVGAWTFAISLQLAVGVLLLLVGYNTEKLSSGLETQNMMTNRYTASMYFGLAHIVVSVCTAAVVALGLFVSSCFLLPLCIISMVQSLLLVATSIFCGVLVRPTVKVAHEAVTTGKFPDVEDLGFKQSEYILAHSFGGYILTAACLSLAALAAYGRAGNLKNDTPIPEAQLYIPCGALLVISATIAAIGGGGESQTVVMATMLFGAALLLALLANIASCCCTPKVFNLVLGGGFACIAILSLVVCGMSSNIYRSVIRDYDAIRFLPSELKMPSKPVPSNVVIFVTMQQGSWLLALACTSLATCILAIFSALYGARSVLFCFGKGDTA